VPPVLDGDGEGVAPAVEVGDDRLDGPVAVAVDDVAPVAVAQQRGIEARIVRPGQRVRPDPDRFAGRVGQDSPRSAIE
jgi:hypothetical protein